MRPPPDVAIVDPNPAETMPKKLMARTGSNLRQPSAEEMETLPKCCYDTEADF